MKATDIKLDAEKFKAVVSIDGKPFTTYCYGHFACRPFFYPLLTPDGQRLTRGYPMEPIEGETEDHPHHRSFYVAHGNVNGYDLWSESIAHGCMLQRGDPQTAVEDGTALIEGMVDWFGPGGERLLDEKRRIAVGAEGELRVIDQCSELRAAHGDVTFGDTKEGGLFTLRVATSMDAKENGRIENSNGNVCEGGQGEESTWGKRATWVDYSGPVANGDQWGLTVVDHPSNPRHPTYWHVRGYGLFAANPFGVSFFENDKSLDGSMTIGNEDAAVFCYRLIVHPGRGMADQDRVHELIDEFTRSDKR